MTDQAGPLKVIFVASLSHSGSTLLDLMLNAHPDVVSVGELKQLGRFARSEKPRPQLNCTCGAESLMSCDFWGGVSAVTKATVGRTIRELNVDDYDDVDTFQGDNVALFEAIAAVAGKRIIVDSSKQVARLARLLEIHQLEVFPIFLLRDPKGQICSSQKRSINLLKLIGIYVRTNRNIYELINNRPHAVVHYEELVRNPEPTLTSLMQSSGLAFDANQLQWAQPVRHNVGGNRMRRRTSSDLKLDEKWREQFSLPQQMVINVGTLLGRYPLVKLGVR